MAEILPRNPGGDLDLDWVLSATVDAGHASALDAALPLRSTLSPTAEDDALLRAIPLIDLTTLSGDDTPARIRALCARALRPLSSSTELPPPLEGPLRVAAVCIYHHFLPIAGEALAGTGVRIAAVAAGFPHGLSPLPQRIDEIRASVGAGAVEIDAVINRSHVLTGAWEALYEEVRAFRQACGAAHLKVILATGELQTLENVARASRLCMLAGADVIKTSTGKEAVNAAFPAGMAMLRSIRDYAERTGYRVGFKAAGGIRAPAQALQWMQLVREELGEEWLRPELFRLGASSLLDEIERRLTELAEG